MTTASPHTWNNRPEQTQCQLRGSPHTWNNRPKQTDSVNIGPRHGRGIRYIIYTGPCHKRGKRDLNKQTLSTTYILCQGSSYTWNIRPEQTENINNVPCHTRETIDLNKQTLSTKDLITHVEQYTQTRHCEASGRICQTFSLKKIQIGK